MSRLSLLAISLLLLLTLTAAGTAAPAVPTAPPAEWQPLPGPSGGSVAALAISPAYATDHTVFAGIRGEGIYRSADGGSSWTATGAGPGAIVDLALSPAFPADDTLFALAGTSAVGYYVYRSADAGTTWEERAMITGGRALAISPDFAHDHTLYLLTGAAMPTYISTDGGATFAGAGGWFDAHDVTALAFSPAYATDHTLFAAVRDDALYRSNDGGTTWDTTLGGDIEAVALSPDYAAEPMVVAIAADGQVHLSLDDGATWDTTFFTLGIGGQFTIAFSPDFATDRLLAVVSSADPGAYRSADGGDSWAQSGWYNPASDYKGFVGGHVQDLVLTPFTNLGGTGFAGTNAALYHTYNQGETWTPLSAPLNRLSVRSLAIAPGRPDLLLAGTGFFDVPRSDTGTLYEWNGNLQLSDNGGVTWRDVSGALQQVHRVAFSPDFAADNTAFATSGTIGQHGFVEGAVYRSRDGGKNWTAVLDDFAYSGLAFSPDYRNDHTLWVAATTYQFPKGIYVSENSGDTWHQLVDGLNLDQIVPSPNYRLDRTLFAGGGDGLHKSTDNGATWSRLLENPLTALAVSPAYGASRTLYAATQLPGQPGALFRSADGGTSWREVDTGMLAGKEGQPITVSTLSFAADGSLLAGIHYGSLADAAILYRSTDGGVRWDPVAGGLEAAVLHTVRTLPAGAMRFYAGSDTGLWQLVVPQGGPGEPGRWRSGGPRGGKAHTLAVSPTFAHDGIAFGGEWLNNLQSTESGLGIIKSSDGGQTWYRSDAGTEGVYYSSAVHDYAFSPAFDTDETVFAATWGGLFKSQDQGKTWTWLASASGATLGATTTVAVAPDFSSSGLVLAGNWHHLLRSDDGGQTWSQDDQVKGSAALAFSPAFATDQTIFAADLNLQRTVNGGTDWQDVLSGTISSLAISPAFAADHTLFAAGGSKLYRSVDGGTTWISNTVTADAPAIYDLAISPAFSTTGTLFAGTATGLFRSDDGGHTWDTVDAYAGTLIHALAISPAWPTHQVLLVGTAAGVDRYLGTETPRQPAQGFVPLSSRSLAWSQAANLLLAGTTNHGLYGTDTRGQSWRAYGLQFGHGYHTINNVAISPAYPADHTLFASYLSGISIGGSLYRSTDAGTTWESVYSLDYIGDIEFSPAFATDNTVYASSGEGHVVRSTAGGDKDSWAQVGTWPAGIQRGAAQEIELPPDYPADPTLFAAGSEGFWRLPPGATTWEQAVFGLGRDYYVEDLEISPAYSSDHTLLAVASTGLYNHYGVYRSHDGGVHWWPAGSGIPDVKLSALAFSPDFAADHTVYLVAADGGLYRSRDGGTSWALAARVPYSGAAYLLALGRDHVAVATGSGVWHYGSATYQILINGNFEADSGWTMPATPYPARYTNTLAYAGQRALQTGIANDSNTFAYSDAYQTITIPAGMNATLRFHYYPVSGETTRASLAALFAPDAREPVAGDLQYALLYSADGSTRLATLLSELSNSQHWQTVTVDLSAYAGQTIRLYFGTYNDGAGGHTALYVDNLSLLISYPPAAYLPLIARH